MRGNICAHIFKRPPDEIRRFIRVSSHRPIVQAAEHVHDLVLAQSIVEVRAIMQGSESGERARYAHFLFEPPRRRRGDIFARPRMPATGVRPEPARVIFIGRSLLEQHAPRAIPDEDRKCAMQSACPVRIELLGNANLSVGRIDQNNELVFHAHQINAQKRARQRAISHNSPQWPTRRLVDRQFGADEPQLGRPD